MTFFPVARYPSSRATSAIVAQLVERLLPKQEVAESYSVYRRNTNTRDMNIYKIAKDRGYRIDDKGDVFSPSMRLNLMRDASGYLFFTIRVNGKCNKVKAHRLQAYIKYGDKIFEKGIVVRHLNGNSLDNSLGNIAIGTQSDNMMDIPKELRISHAQKAGDAVRIYDHEAVYQYYLQTKSYKKAKEKFGIQSKATVHAIISKYKKQNI